MLPHFACLLATLLACLLVRHLETDQRPNQTTGMKLSESDSILFRFDLRVEAPGLVRCENTLGKHRHGSSRALLSRLSCDFILIVLKRLGASGLVPVDRPPLLFVKARWGVLALK